MKKVTINCIIGMMALTFFSVQKTIAQTDVGQEDPSATIIALEKAALTRWNNGDPAGYLELCAEGITYFDPGSLARINGYSALKKLYDPLTGKIYSDRFELLTPQVQLQGDTGILTYNLVTYSGGKVTSRWNSTEVYSKIEGTWKIVHSHWSYTKHEESKEAEDVGDEAIKKAVLKANQRLNDAGADVDQFFTHILDFDDGMIIQNTTLFKTSQEAYEAVKQGMQGVTEIDRTYDQTHVRVLSAQLALLTGTGVSRITFDSGQTMQVTFSVSSLFQLNQGQWKLLHGHYTSSM